MLETKTTGRKSFLTACKGEKLERPPVWMMRQAGRYLPEYRALKEKYNFHQMVKTPELAMEVTMQPMMRFAFDAAIIFSDILVIPEAMGQGYSFKEKETGGGIAMDYALDSAKKIEKLDEKNIEEKLSYVGEALRLVRTEIGNEKALLGFGGSPWTLATYMIEGGSTKEFTKVNAFAYSEPKLFEKLLNKITNALIDYFKMQIRAGVDAIQIFDSWGSACTGSEYWNLSLKWIKKIIDALPEDFCFIVYAKGMAIHAKDLLRTGAKVLSVDWTVKMADLRKTVPGKYTLQGNLDPNLMTTTTEIVRSATLKILENMSPYPGFIFNLGHGITPQAKIENVEAMVETIINFESQ